MRGGEEYGTVFSLLCFADIACVEALSCLSGCQSRGNYDLRLFAIAGWSYVGGRPWHCAA